jgi:hypothetical protein
LPRRPERFDVVAVLREAGLSLCDVGYEALSERYSIDRRTRAVFERAAVVFMGGTLASRAP